MKKNMQKRLLIITLTLIFAVVICGTVSAADSTSDNGTFPSDTLQAQNDNQTAYQSNSTPQSTTSDTNQFDIQQVGSQGSNQASPDPRIVRGGVVLPTIYTTIQAAINAAQNGDTIRLEDSATFYENIVINKNLIFDVFNNGHATIDGSNNGRVVTINGDRTVTFIGITITNGVTINSWPQLQFNGGGIINNGNGRLTLLNCNIINNHATWTGGGVYSNGPLTAIGCNFQGNTADGLAGVTGGAIFVANQNSVLNFNRIVGNSQTQVWKTGTNNIDARYNWWGSNNQPTQQANIWDPRGDYHNANVGPWTTLSISASPNLIYNGQNSAVTAQFSYNVPNGTPVLFSLTNGPFGNFNGLASPVTVLTNGGLASIWFNATSVGTQTVRATVDNQYVETNIVINPAANVDLWKEFRQTRNGPVITEADYRDTVWAVIGAHNKGPDTATVTITDTSLGFTPTPTSNVNYYVSFDNGVSWTRYDASYNPTTGVWTINIPAGLTYLLAIQGRVDQTGTVTNTAQQTAQDIGHTEPFETVTATLSVDPAANINLASLFRANYNGPNITTANYYDYVWAVIRAHNAGPDSANVVITDVPSGFTPDGTYRVNYNDGTGWHLNDGSFNLATGEWTITMPANATYLLALYGQITATGIVNHTATQIYQNVYNWTPFESKTANLTVQPAADIAVTKTVNDTTPNVLDTIIYTITVRNNGPDQAINVLVNDMLPAGLTYDHYTVTGSSGSDGFITWNSTTRTFTINGTYFDPNGYVTVDLYAIVNTILGGQHVDNTASLMSLDQYDWNTTNNASTVGIDVKPAADLGIIKDVNNSSPNIGDLLDYTIMAYNSNTSPNNATGVTVTDTIPVGLTYVGNDHPGSTTWDPINRVLTWIVGNLNIGQFDILHVWATVDAQPQVPSITNTANITADEYDWNLANNQDSETIYEPVANIVLSKEFRDDDWNVINSANYQDGIWTVIKAHNNGPNNATNIQISDALPTGLIPNYSWIWLSTNGGEDWDLTSSYSGNIWTINNITNGAWYLLAIWTQVTAHNTTVTNTATQTAQDQYSYGFDSASATLDVQPAAYVDLYKEFRDDPWGNVITQAYYKDKIYAMVRVLNEGPDSTSLSVLDSLTGINWTGNYYVLSGSVNPNDPNNWVLNDPVNTFDGSYWNIPFFSHAMGGNVKWLAIEGIVDQTGEDAVSNYAETDDQSSYPYDGYDSDTAYLTANAAPTSLSVNSPSGYNGDTVGITATLTDTAHNVPVAGKQVTITVNGQSYSDTTDSNGQITWQFPINNMDANDYTIQVSFAGDDQYASSSSTGTLTVNLIPTSLTVDPASGYKDDSTTLTARLWDTVHNIAVSGKSVAFYVNGVLQGTGTTNSSGFATWTYNIAQDVGVYPNIIGAVFTADTQYAGSFGNNTLTVNATPTSLTVNNITGDKGHSVDLKATLWDTFHDNAIAGKTVTFKVNGTIVGSAPTDASGVATLPYTINLVGGNYTINAEFAADNQYVGSTSNGTLKVPQANVYIQITPSKTNPTVGENIVITVKVGNYGPDAAQGVIVSYTVPSGFEFVNVSADAGITPVYDPATRTVTWNLGNVPVGDPYMYVTLKALSSGTFDNIARIIGEITYDPNTGNKASSIAINVQQPVPNVNAASKTIPMQPTGLPLAGLVLAILAVFGGLVMPKRKN